MKKTLLLMAALFTLGSAAVSAQDDDKVYATFASPTTTPNTSWDAESNTFKWTSTSWNQLQNIGLPSGNITEYEKLVIDCTIVSGNQFRILVYKGNENKTLWVKQSGASEFVLTEAITDMTFLTNCTEICLSGDAAGWNGGGDNATGEVVINSMYLVKSLDQLAVPKKVLSDKIVLGKLYSSVAKTEASFAALTSAITAAETAYSAADATAESLQLATTNIEAAIAGLTLQPGYTDLTKEMFQKWSSQGAASGEPAESWTNAYVLYTSTGQPYGDGSVDWLHYADLSAYDKLIVVVAAGPGRPRYCFNRTVNGGQDTDDGTNSGMIDIPNKTWGTAAYENIEVEGKVYTIDLKKMTKEQGFAYLHAIKTVQGNATISDMLLYKDPAITLTSSADLQGYKTFCNAEQAYSVDDQTTIYKVVSLSEEKAIVEAVAGNIVPAATPVILKTSNTEDYKITLTPTAEASTDDFGDNMLEVASPTFAPTGYVLGYTAADGIAFYGGQTIIDGDVYLPALVSIGGGAKGRLSISFGGETTAINGVDAKSAQEGAIYNVAGQKVNAAYKGIVIKNGKKYLNK